MQDPKSPDEVYVNILTFIMLYNNIYIMYYHLP